MPDLVTNLRRASLAESAASGRIGVYRNRRTAYDYAAYPNADARAAEHAD